MLIYVLPEGLRGDMLCICDPSRQKGPSGWIALRCVMTRIRDVKYIYFLNNNNKINNKNNVYFKNSFSFLLTLPDVTLSRHYAT